MKRLIIILIAIICLVGCSSKDSKIRILVPNGIPLIAIGGLINHDNMIIEDVYGPDLLTSAMTSNSHDIIIAPLNLGAKLYIVKGSKYKLHSLLTFGNNYIVTRKTNKLDSIDDLENQSILAFAQNSTPDIILKAALKTKNVLSNITYQSSVDLVLPYFILNQENPEDESGIEAKYVLITEPLISKIEIEYGLPLNILNLQEVIKEQNDLIPQAAIFVRPDIDKNKLNNFLEEIKENEAFINDNPKQYAKTIVSNHRYFSQLKEDIIAQCIPRCNIKYLNAKENQSIIENYYRLLNNYNQKLLNGITPDSGFYY